MLADELRKTYNLHTRELSKEEVLEMYGEVVEYYVSKLREYKTIRSLKFLDVNVFETSVKFRVLEKSIPFLHFKSIVKYFESEGLEVKYTKTSIEFSW